MARKEVAQPDIGARKGEALRILKRGGQVTAVLAVLSGAGVVVADKVLIIEGAKSLTVLTRK